MVGEWATRRRHADRIELGRLQRVPSARTLAQLLTTARASVPMHRWLHRRSHETGQTIQEIINDALKAARGDG